MIRSLHKTAARLQGLSCKIYKHPQMPKFLVRAELIQRAGFTLASNVGMRQVNVTIRPVTVAVPARHKQVGRPIVNARHCSWTVVDTLKNRD